MSKIPEAKARRALLGSIAKWVLLAGNPDRQKMYGIYCPLCWLYVGIDTDTDLPTCGGCPVRKRTGQPECWGTPFYGARESESPVDCLDELNFLVSLMPGDYQPFTLESAKAAAPVAREIAEKVKRELANDRRRYLVL